MHTCAFLGGKAAEAKLDKLNPKGPVSGKLYVLISTIKILME